MNGLSALELVVLIAYNLTLYSVIALDSSFAPRIQVKIGKTGEKMWLSGDIVLAADGIKSAVRKQMALAGGYAHSDQPYPTGDAAYRLIIPRERIQHDPELLAMMNQDVAFRYMGPAGHVMAYPLRKNKLYNMVLIHPAKVTTDVAENVWTSMGDRRDMTDFYASWSPLIKRWLSYAEEEDNAKILEWTLNTYPPLPTWVRGKVALIGDACHPMLPYVAQGAANGIEDAAVIATALTCTSDVQLALGVYEVVRKERAEKIAASASGTGRSLHLLDGPEQEQRDQAIRNTESRGVANKSGTEDKWRDQQWQDYMWGIDVMLETIEKWDELSAAVKAKSTYSLSTTDMAKSLRMFLSNVFTLLDSPYIAFWKRTT